MTVYMTEIRGNILFVLAALGGLKIRLFLRTIYFSV